MKRKRAFAVAVALIALACFRFESSSFAQVRQKSKTGSKKSSASANGNPTAADAKVAIETQISGGRFEVTNITKTNGAGTPLLNQYQIFYRVQVKCLVSEGKPFQWRIVDFGTTEAITCVNEGDVRTGTGNLHFKRTEQGWKLMGSHHPGWFEFAKGSVPSSKSEVMRVPAADSIKSALQLAQEEKPIPEGSIIDVPGRSGTVRVKNFYNSAQQILGNQVIVLSSKGIEFEIHYERSSSLFTLLLLPDSDKRYGEYLRLAEHAFLAVLGITKSDACRLNVVVEITETYKDTFGLKAPLETSLSFCAAV